MSKKSTYAPIGIFDSGFGGLTILKDIVAEMPGYDYLYLGDNARSPYGSRSFEKVYDYTLECVKHLFNKGCHLVILACNTSSAKALRTIQQKDLPLLSPKKRVLGVIRPTTEIIGKYSKTGHVGILATSGTVSSKSYLVEINKFYPNLKVYQQACPMWVPLIENNELNSPGSDYFIEKYVKQLIDKEPKIDVVILACTHYPLISKKIKSFLPKHVKLISQGSIVANSLKNYLNQHPEMEKKISKENKLDFYTTELITDFDQLASSFFGKVVVSKKITL